MVPSASREVGADGVAVSVLVMPTRCWQCRQVTYPVVGVLIPAAGGARFLEFAEVAHRLAAAVSRDDLRVLGTGPIKRRHSRLRPKGYLSNGCVHCDAIQGNFPLREDLAVFSAEGGRLHDLIAGTLVLPRR